MSEDIEKRIYKFGEEYYSFEEINNIYTRASDNKKKNIKDCVCHFILADILKRGNQQKHGEELDNIAMYEFEHIETGMSKGENIVYSLLISRLLGLAGIKNRYKASVLKNGEWFLNNLVSLTLGSSYPTYSNENLKLVNHNDL